MKLLPLLAFLMTAGYFVVAVARASRVDFSGGIRARLDRMRLLPTAGEVALLTGAAAAAEGEALPGARGRRYSREHLARMDEALDIFDRATRGSYAAKAQLQEALASGDFPLLFADILDREMLQQYQALPSVWQRFARRTLVNNFRPKKLLDLLGGQAGLSKVPELTEFPARQLTEGSYSLTVAKYGDRFALSWEMVVNDDLGQFADLPQRLAVAARETEDKVAASLVASATGPNAALFNANAVHGPGFDVDTSATANTSSNLLTGNPALTAAALQSALTAISSRRDVDGRPIVVTAAVLMVPPALEIAARQILNATEIVTQVGTGSGSQLVKTENFLRNIVTLVVNPWLPVVDTSVNVNTTWYLLPAPTTGRPALTLGFLNGYETPDLRVKANAGQRVGGGTIDPREGSFEIDDIQYRVRHVLGGAPLDAIATAASNGSGS